MKLHLIRKVDSFKSNWFLWECEQEQSDESLVTGYVQADFTGDLIAEETFELEQ